MSTSSTGRARRAPGREPRRLDGERSRERILDAAERLLAERGYSGTGIAAISRASGLPNSSIYWFFDSKRDLTAAVVERAAARWLDGLETLDEPDLAQCLTWALARSGDKLPDFVRLHVLLALERGDADRALQSRLDGIRARQRALLGPVVARSLTTAERGLAEASPRLTAELADLASAMATGLLVSRHMDPDGREPGDLAGELEAAIRAAASHRLAKEAS